MLEETTFTEHLRPGQKIFVYFRFEHMQQRFFRAVVQEVDDARVKLLCDQDEYVVTIPSGQRLIMSEDGRGDPCLEGRPGGIDAHIQAYSRKNKSGRVYLYPETDIWAKYHSFSG